MSFNRFSNQKGLTLIEIVVAIVIIGIILLSINGLILQSKKTTVSSETIVDATYIAQETLEYVYSLSKSSNFNNFTSHFDFQPNFNVTTNTSTEIKLSYTYKNPIYNVEIHVAKVTHAASKFPDSTDLNLHNVIINVSENGDLKNTVESIYKFN